MGMKFLSKLGNMYEAYVFLYEAPAQHNGDVCTQLERREKF